MTRIYNKTSEKEKRRTLRQNMTKAEGLLWARLRNRQVAACKFRRQYSVERFVLDFYCPELKLAIEIDGPTHCSEAAIAYDAVRQAAIEALGIGFLRFTNQAVYENLDSVVEQIAQTVHHWRQRQTDYTLLEGHSSMANMIYQHGSGDNIAGDKVMGNKIGTQINHSQDLAQAAQAIKALLDQLDQNYDRTTPTGQAMISAKTVEAIENNPTLKARIINALKEGGTTALEELVDHPAIKPVVALIKGFADA